MNETQLLMEYAKCWNNRDTAFVEPHLHEDVVYDSQWVFASLEGKDAYLNYLNGKFATLRNDFYTDAISADIGYFKGGYFGKEKPCLIVTQHKMQEDEIVEVTILIEVKDEKIIKIDMCGIPHPSGAELFRVYPK